MYMRYSPVHNGQGKTDQVNVVFSFLSPYKSHKRHLFKNKTQKWKIHDNLANAEITRGMSRTKYYIDVSLPAESPAPPPKIGPFLLSL